MKGKTNWLVRLAVVFLLVFSVVTVITIQAELSELKTQKAELEKQLDDYTEQVEKMRYELSLSLEEYIEKYAREVLGYHKNGEIIYKNAD